MRSKRSTLITSAKSDSPVLYVISSNSKSNDGEKVMSTAKDEAIKTISRLPEEASWDEIMYKIYVKRKIDEGLKAAEEGRTISHEEVKELFGLNEN
jgi:predicted transcriptional regulator